MCHRAKFHKNRLNRGRDMVIFIFLNMAATAILDFQNFNFSTVRTVKRVELHHYAKFCRNRFNRGQDIAIFRFFKMAAAAILDFQNLKFLTFVTVKRVELHRRTKFRRNRLNRGRDMVFLDFSKWRPPPSDDDRLTDDRQTDGQEYIANVNVSSRSLKT